MHKSRHEPTLTAHFPLRWDKLALGVCGLAVTFALGLPHAVMAQDINPVVDLADPNVSVDLSVLNDGGIAPLPMSPMAATPAAATHPEGAAYQAPGKKMPVSTLYIKPASGFKLPPPSKTLERKVAKIVTPPPAPVAPPEAIQAAPEPAPTPMPAPVEVAETPVPMPAPIAEPARAPAPTPTPVVETTPTPMPKPAEEVAAVAPAPEPTPEPEAKPMALEAEHPTAPPPPPAAALEAATETTPEPASEVAALLELKTDEVAPPPPPQAAPEPALAPAVEHDETQTAPKANEIVMPLPPREEVASLPPATGPLSDGDSMRIVFDSESSKLPQNARDALSDIAGKMQTQENLRLQLLAYAGNADTSASAARRLSLSRALAVRSFLIENGVRSTRIDVRALGNKSTDAVSERVDITVVER